MGEEIFDLLNVSANHSNHIPGATFDQVGGGDGVHLSIHVDAHFCEEPICEVVGEPPLGPGEEGSEGSEHSEQYQVEGQVLAAEYLPHEQGANNA